MKEVDKNNNYGTHMERNVSIIGHTWKGMSLLGDTHGEECLYYGTHMERNVSIMEHTWRGMYLL